MDTDGSSKMNIFLIGYDTNIHMRTIVIYNSRK